MKRSLQAASLAAAIALTTASRADTVIQVNAGDPWTGYMNVFDLPEDGGAYRFGSPWGTADLRAVFSGSTLTLSPNTIGDPNEYWYKNTSGVATPPNVGGPGQAGNKIMEANLYVQKSDGSLSGQNVKFTGTVNSNTLTEHDAIVFIRDWSSGFASKNEVSAPLVAGETFSIDLNTDPTPGRTVQYGFQVKGVNVWVTDVAPFGKVEIAATPLVQGDPNVKVNPASEWKGYMNVFNLAPPAGDGQFVPALGGVWGPPDLRANFSGQVLTLAPNNNETAGGLGDTTWYQPDGSGNKRMDANMYVEPVPGTFTGLLMNFSGYVLSNTLTSQHTAVAFIKEFSADYSSVVNEITVPLVPGPFSISKQMSSNPSNHVQYGFQMVGPNVWKENAAAFGSVQVVDTAASPFAQWMNTQNFAGFTNPDLGVSGDPDGDSKTNLEEFAFNDNPASGSASGRIRSRVTTVSGAQALVLTLPARGNPVFSGSPSKTGTADGVQYTFEGSNNLGTFDQPVSEVTPADSAGMPAPGSGWSYRSFRLDGDIGGPTPRGPRGFLRARVSPVP